MVNKPPYECIRCGYKTNDKYLMRRHFYDKKKTCQGIVNNIELTDDIKECILENRKYKMPLENEKLNKQIKKLEQDVMFLKAKKSEAFFQSILETYLQGSHKSVKSGVTDITTDTIHAEIKDWSSWKYALGQLLAYNFSEPKLYLHVYLFSTMRPKKEKRDEVFTIFKQHNITPFEFICDDINVKIIDENEIVVHEN